MTDYPVLAILFLALWAWAVFVNLRERRWIEAGGWAVVGVIGAALFGGRVDQFPDWLKVVVAAAFVAISLTLSWRQMRRGFHQH
jgi:hypothetical protein